MVAEYNYETTAVAVVESAQAVTVERIRAVKDVIASGCTDAELLVFAEACKRTGLDPFAKQIYAIKRGGKLTIQTGIDGYRVLAERSGKYAGQLGPFWCGADGEWHDVWLSDVAPLACKIGILRSDFREPIWAIARTAAYKQDTNSLWKTMPDVLIAKCAEALGLRRAFPAQLAGVYTAEEMEQADSMPSVPSVPENSDGEFVYTTQAAPARGKRVTPVAPAKAPSWTDLKARAATLGIDEANWPLTVQAWTGKAEGYTAQDKQTVRDRLDQRERMGATADLTQMGEMRV